MSCFSLIFAEYSLKPPPPPPPTPSSPPSSPSSSCSSSSFCEGEMPIVPMSSSMSSSKKWSMPPDSPRSVTATESFVTTESRNDEASVPRSKNSVLVPILLVEYFESPIKVLDYPKSKPVPPECYDAAPSAATTMSVASRKYRASTLDLRGIQWGRRGYWEEALSCWLEAWHLRTTINTTTSKSLREVSDMARTANNVGVALLRLQRYEEAMDYGERAVRMEKQLLLSRYSSSSSRVMRPDQRQDQQHRRDYASSLYNLAVAYHQVGRSDLAMAHLQNASTVLQGFSSRRGTRMAMIRRAGPRSRTTQDTSASGKLQAAVSYRLALACESAQCYAEAWEALEESQYWLRKEQGEQQQQLQLDKAMSISSSSSRRQDREDRQERLIQDKQQQLEDVLANNLDLSFAFE